MKRIDAFIQMEAVPKVLDALKQDGFEGVTVTQSLGRGSGDHPWIGGREGHPIEFNAVNTITVMIKDSNVEQVVEIILKAGYVGTVGDGKIFISSIDDAIDIHTKQRGDHAIG